MEKTFYKKFHGYKFETIYSYLAKYFKFFEWLIKPTAHMFFFRNKAEQIESFLLLSEHIHCSLQFFLYFSNLIIFSTKERKKSLKLKMKITNSIIFYDLLLQLIYSVNTIIEIKNT